MIARAGDHQVIEDAASLVGELRVALLARLQSRDVARHDRLQRLGRVLSRLGGWSRTLGPMWLTSNRRPRCGLGMLGQDAGRILDRHS